MIIKFVSVSCCYTDLHSEDLIGYRHSIGTTVLISRAQTLLLQTVKWSWGPKPALQTTCPYDCTFTRQCIAAAGMSGWCDCHVRKNSCNIQWFECILPTGVYNVPCPTVCTVYYTLRPSSTWDIPEFTQYHLLPLKPAIETEGLSIQCLQLSVQQFSPFTHLIHHYKLYNSHKPLNVTYHLGIQVAQHTKAPSTYHPNLKTLPKYFTHKHRFVLNQCFLKNT